MGVARLIFDKQEAITGLKEWVEFVLAAHYSASEIRRGRRNAPSSSQRGVTVIPTTTVPVKEAWTDVVVESLQANLVHVQVVAAAAGLYRLRVLGQNADYVAGGGDDATAIRDGLRAAVDALALAVTTADVGGSSFSILGDTAGQWLGVAPVSTPVADALAVTVVDDVKRRASGSLGRWTLRIIIDDIRPAMGNSSVQDAADLVRNYLDAASVPVVNGSAVIYTDDYLAQVGLVYLSAGDPIVADYQGDGGPAPVWRERAMIDVVFNVTTGLAFDIPTIETFGQPAETITDI